VVDGVNTLVRDDAETIVPLLRALTPLASTALRAAYEIGDFLVKNPSPTCRITASASSSRKRSGSCSVASS
jgi:hypothetical protein